MNDLSKLSPSCRWYYKNKEKAKEIHRQWIKANRDYYNKYQRNWRRRNKKHYSLWQRKHWKMYKNKWNPKRNKYWRDYRKKSRFLVIEHYSNGTMKCACCSESIYEFLTVDDIKGNIHKKFIKTKKSSTFNIWLVKNNYPKGFQILCWNCNCSKGLYSTCPHNR